MAEWVRKRRNVVLNSLKSAQMVRKGQEENGDHWQTGRHSDRRKEDCNHFEEIGDHCRKVGTATERTKTL